MLKEVRIAFLEEELPALVAKGASLADARVRCAVINQKLGEKFEIADAELTGTFEACVSVIASGADVAGDTQAATRMLAEEAAKEQREAQVGAAGPMPHHHEPL